MAIDLSRREVISGAIAAGVALGAGANVASGRVLGEHQRTAETLVALDASAAPAKVKFSLNMSTIRGQKLPLDQQFDIAHQAGYDCVEPWLGDIEAYKKSGKSLADLKKRTADQGMTVESAIGFAQWIVDDPAQRAKGLEQARRDMDLVAQLGGKRIAAPPAGATDKADLNLLAAAERYRKLCEVGDAIGVVPQVEVWGFSKCLSRLGETTLVALESGHPKACILPDIYHLYKGGSEFGGLHFLTGSAVQVFHMNDYPTDPPRAKIADAHRVYPGDGVAPTKEILRTLFASGFAGVLSLELFNPEYWKQDALLVAKSGLEKMRAAVAGATSKA